MNVEWKEFPAPPAPAWKKHSPHQRYSKSCKAYKVVYFWPLFCKFSARSSKRDGRGELVVVVVVVVWAAFTLSVHLLQPLFLFEFSLGE